jgi:DNA polymerase elongation subunit (family B)
MSFLSRDYFGTDTYFVHHGGFQRSLILALLSGKDCEQVRTEGYAKAKELLIEAVRRIMEGDVPVGDLAVSKVLRRPLSSYNRAVAHISVKSGRKAPRSVDRYKDHIHQARTSGNFQENRD